MLCLILLNEQVQKPPQLVTPLPLPQRMANAFNASGDRGWGREGKATGNDNNSGKIQGPIVYHPRGYPERSLAYLS